jgi:lysine 2,3-aminomutase
MKEKLTPYLKAISHKESIAKQYLINSTEIGFHDYNDPLMEDAHEVVKGLIHKYKNRALIKVSYLCAAHCRFCTRIRQIGNPEGELQKDDIINIVNYLIEHPEIEDVILSGGDPFLTPKKTAILLEEINKIESVKVLRIGTRLPLQSPKSFNSKSISQLLDVIDKISINKPFYILLHAEHPDELTKEAIASINIIRKKTRTILLSQTVFLEGINIDLDILYSLFKKLYFVGVTPYYIYHCDSVNGLEHFVGDIEVEKEIMRRLRDTLSGIACPTFVADLENEYGKYPFDLEIIKTIANNVYKK